MERDDRPPVATFVAEAAPLAPDALVELDEAAAHHARVKRLAVGDVVNLTNGRGQRGWGRLTVLSKGRAVVALEEVGSVPPPPPVHLLAPIGDRDRMLWLAEKAVELGVTSWRPVMWRRSASVSPRGSGEAFELKVRARMSSALEQSASAWLPELRPELRGSEVAELVPEPDDGVALLLDAGAPPLLSHALRVPVTIALGPEGGLEDDERYALRAVGFAPASLGPNILRFETAGVAALAVVRAALHA